MRGIVLSLLIVVLLSPVAAQLPAEYKGEVICVSGNCAKGKGRVRLPGMDNREIEGGLLPGRYNEGKIFTEAGELIYEGGIFNFVAHGDGKKFERRDDGKDHLIQQGRFENGIFVAGEVFNDDGLTITSGRYDSTGKFLSGAELVFFRGKPAYLSPVGSTLKNPAGDVFTETIIRDGYKPDSRTLYTAGYKNDRLHGYVRFYDYGNSVIFNADFKDGKLARNEDGSVKQGFIMNITEKGYQGNERIASMVVFEDKLDGEGIFDPIILSGQFAFDKGPQKLITTPKGETSMVKFREMYALLYKPQLDARGNPIPYVPPKDLWQGTKTKADVEQGLAEIDTYYTEMMEKGKKGASIVSLTSKTTFNADERELMSIRDDIITHLDVLIRRYRNIVPASRISDLEAWKKDAFRAFTMPAYATLRK
jgi:antitoxin component YwqK of YwqJK toxin-antitoxin module